MCDAVGIGLGVAALSGAANASQAKTEADYANAVAEQKYQLAKRNTERENQIASQNYQNQLRIAGRADTEKAKNYEDRLKAFEEALNANVRQSEINAISANLAAAEIGVKAKTANAQASFDVEKALATMIQKQGEVLATGGAGQSFLLQSQQAERSFGMTTQKLNEVLFNQNLGFGLELQGVEMDYFSSEIAAYNQLPPPPRPEQASFLPYVPILDPGPSKPVKREPNYFAACLGGAAAGVGAFGQAGGAQPAPAPKGKTP